MGKERSEEVTITILGASGDLCKRKLIPALYHLYLSGALPSDFKIVGYARTHYSTQEFHQHLKESYRYGEMEQQFFSHITYSAGDYDKNEGFRKLDEHFKEIKASPNRLFYLAVPPHTVRPIISHLKATKLISNCAVIDNCKYLSSHDQGWTRIIFEKPFGHDFDSAKDLEDFLHSHLQEDQILRIDHYLGKETVQNILAFRFANNIFEPIWNHHFVESIEINIAEDLTVGDRGGYFDQSGILRDIVQNHALQLLSLITMEPPASLKPRAIRNEKIKLLESLMIPTKESVIGQSLRGQYEGYLNENGVNKKSQTETFVSLKIFIDNWRWANTPIYIRAGKGLADKTTEVAVTFKKVPHGLFQTAKFSSYIPKNILLFKIQPKEGIHLLFNTKVPGVQLDLTPVNMNFSYQEKFTGRILDAYERLLLDALNADSSLFIGHEEVLASWRYIDTILKGWGTYSQEIPLHRYNVGQYGPEAMYQWIKQDGYQWNFDTCLLKI